MIYFDIIDVCDLRNELAKISEKSFISGPARAHSHFQDVFWSGYVFSKRSTNRGKFERLFLFFSPG